MNVDFTEQGTRTNIESATKAFQVSDLSSALFHASSVLSVDPQNAAMRSILDQIVARAGAETLLKAAVEANLEHLRPWMEWIAFELQTVTQRAELLQKWDREWLEPLEDRPRWAGPEAGRSVDGIGTSVDRTSLGVRMFTIWA